MSNLTTKPFLWIVGGVAGLMVIILGITLGTVLTARGIPFWPKADLPTCIDMQLTKGSWDPEFTDPDFSDPYEIEVEVCNYNLDNRDTKGRNHPTAVRTYWGPERDRDDDYDTEKIHELTDDYGQTEPHGHIDSLEPGECRPITLTVNFDNYWLNELRQEGDTVQVIFNVEAMHHLIAPIGGWVGCGKKISQTITFGEGREQECETDDDCSEPTSHCNQDGVCVECVDATHCAGEEECCDEECVDTGTNGEHCGECNHPCEPDEICQDGECVELPPGTPIVAIDSCTIDPDGDGSDKKVECQGTATDDGTIVSIEIDFDIEGLDTVSGNETPTLSGGNWTAEHMYNTYNTYDIKFTATDGEGKSGSDTYYNLELESPGFSLLPIGDDPDCSPDADNPYQVNFAWNEKAGADNYIVEYKRGNDDFETQPIFSSGDINPAGHCANQICKFGPVSIECSHYYYWRVLAFDSGAEESKQASDPFYFGCCPSGRVSCNSFQLKDTQGNPIAPGAIVLGGSDIEIDAQGSHDNPDIGLDIINFYYKQRGDHPKSARFGWTQCGGTTPCNASTTLHITDMATGVYTAFVEIHDNEPGSDYLGCTGNPDYKEGEKDWENWDSCPVCSQEFTIQVGEKPVEGGCLPSDLHTGGNHNIALATKDECLEWWNSFGYNYYVSLNGWGLENTITGSCQEWNGSEWTDAGGSTCTYNIADGYLSCEADPEGAPSASCPAIKSRTGCMVYGRCPPDLAVTGLSLPSQFVDTGDEICFQVAYSNVGGVILPESLDDPYLYISVYVDDKLVTEEGIYEGLEVKESKTYTTEECWTATEGDHTIKGVIESPLLDEEDLADNEAVLAITVPTATEDPGGEVCNLCGCTADGENCGGRACNQECWQCLMKEAKRIDNRYEYAYTWTVLGCLPVKPASFIIWFLRFATGIGGGIAFLIMVAGAFKVLTSQGDTIKLISGKKMIRGAILGILVIVFVVIILRIVGFDILRLPGFQINP